MLQWLSCYELFACILTSILYIEVNMPDSWTIYSVNISFFPCSWHKYQYRLFQSSSTLAVWCHASWEGAWQCMHTYRSQHIYLNHTNFLLNMNYNILWFSCCGFSHVIFHISIPVIYSSPTRDTLQSSYKWMQLQTTPTILASQLNSRHGTSLSWKS